MVLRFLVQLTSAALDYAVAFGHRNDCAEEAFHIHGKSAPGAGIEAGYVVSVQLGLDRNLQLIAAIYLSPAGEAGLHVVGAVFIALGHEVILVPEGGARADDAHVADEDVPNLGQLIQTGFAKELANAGDILLGVLQQVRGGVAGGAHLHAAELVQREEALALAHSLLGEEGGTRVGQLDGDDEHNEHGRKHHQSHEGEDDVDDAFEEMLVHGGGNKIRRGRVSPKESCGI